MIGKWRIPEYRITHTLDVPEERNLRVHVSGTDWEQQVRRVKVVMSGQAGQEPDTCRVVLTLTDADWVPSGLATVFLHDLSPVPEWLIEVVRTVEQKITAEARLLS